MSDKYQLISMRIPKDLYLKYKQILKSEGKIVTYEYRNFVRKYVENFEKNKYSEQKEVIISRDKEQQYQKDNTGVIYREKEED
ncbi:hypothetical protein CUM88_12675 [Enterococcus faecium]|uniref:hypothetical protein n=1 Tax=Enterococcus TaxID=1350 RepID=UPI0002A41E3C|nr:MULTISPECIES: hypothetical protein [Enterococcus]HAQ1361811.1 hypothetical protein [Enterococcus faecium Ef_aus0098]HAQ1364713.1 hypothetical protein [Enterococcus faecium Ef_aus0094]EGP0013848.1 hypothetical protein [Enterococcus faecium]EGP5103807.1 hypothetical protein [Enterococcus faecium]ELB27461.1 hypothetical protein OK3_05781 [Enterococcus faecium EnGen0036]